MIQDKRKHHNTEVRAGLLFRLLVIALVLLILPLVVAWLLPLENSYELQRVIGRLGHTYYILLIIGFLPLVLLFRRIALELMIMGAVITIISIAMIRLIASPIHVDTLMTDGGYYHLSAEHVRDQSDDASQLFSLTIHQCNAQNSACSKMIVGNLYSDSSVPNARFVVDEMGVYLCGVEPDGTAYLMPPAFGDAALLDFPVINHAQCH